MIGRTQTVVDAVERALARGEGRLARSMRHLSALAGPGGSCVVLRHGRHGETRVSDRAWSGTAGTAVVGLGRRAGFDGIEIRVGRDASRHPGEDCALVSAALGVVAAMADVSLGAH